MTGKNEQKNSGYIRMAFLKAAQYAAGTAAVVAPTLTGLMLWAGPEPQNGFAVTVAGTLIAAAWGGAVGLYAGAKKASRLLEQHMTP